MPYKLSGDNIYVALQRGDEEMAPSKPRQIGLMDGMIGNLIDPRDWSVSEVVLSDYNMGETCWVELPRSQKANVLKQMQRLGSDQADKNFRRTTDFVDYKTFAPHVVSQCPDFLTKVHQHKFRLPMLRMSKLPDDSVKPSKDKELTVAAIPDVGQITSGNYTIGPGGASYPTFGGVGGFAAALGNLTGALTGTHTGAITEAATALFDVDLQNQLLTVTTSVPHLGDPTAANKICVNLSNATMFGIELEGPGTLDFGGLSACWTGAANNSNRIVDVTGVVVAFTGTFRDMLLDGNGQKSYLGFQIGDTDPLIRLLNIVSWDNKDDGFVIRGCATDLTYVENCDSYDNGDDGFNCVFNGSIRFRNCAGWDNPGGDWTNHGNADCQSVNSLSSDASANAFGGGAGNIVNTAAAACVQSVDDTNSAFLDILSGGALDGAGAANTLARATGIRGRAVPGPNGTSIGAAERAAPSGSSRRSRISMGVGIGIR